MASVTLTIRGAPFQEEHDRSPLSQQPKDNKFANLSSRALPHQRQKEVEAAIASGTSSASAGSPLQEKKDRTSVSPQPNDAKCIIITLSPETHLMIFKRLDRASSTCLGLTTKIFYPIHKKLRGNVPLAAFCFFPYSKVSCGMRLYTLLKPWMGKDWVYSDVEDKFVSRQLFSEQVPDLFWTERPVKALLRELKEKRMDAKEIGNRLWCV